MQRAHVVETTTVIRRDTHRYSPVWQGGVVLGCIALLFVIIALAAPGWNGRALIKDCGSDCVNTTVLSFMSILFLTLSLITTTLFALRMITSFSYGVELSTVIFFVIGGVFIVAAYSSFLGYNASWYSFYLMITAGILTFVASTIVSFWLGQTWTTF